MVYNNKLKTSRLYALSKTPLKLLLDNQVNFSGNRLKSIRDDGAHVIVKLADKSVFGNSNITMVFDRESLDLRRWSLTDERGLTTTVTISNATKGVRAPAGTFTIDYAANQYQNEIVGSATDRGSRCARSVAAVEMPHPAQLRKQHRP